MNPHDERIPVTAARPHGVDTEAGARPETTTTTTIWGMSTGRPPLSIRGLADVVLDSWRAGMRTYRHRRAFYKGLPSADRWRQWYISGISTAIILAAVEVAIRLTGGVAGILVGIALLVFIGIVAVGADESVRWRRGYYGALSSAEVTRHRFGDDGAWCPSLSIRHHAALVQDALRSLLRTYHHSRAFARWVPTAERWTWWGARAVATILVLAALVVSLTLDGGLLGLSVVLVLEGVLLLIVAGIIESARWRSRLYYGALTAGAPR